MNTHKLSTRRPVILYSICSTGRSEMQHKTCSNGKISYNSNTLQACILCSKETWWTGSQGKMLNKPVCTAPESPRGKFSCTNKSFITPLCCTFPLATDPEMRPRRSVTSSIWAAGMSSSWHVLMLCAKKKVPATTIIKLRKVILPRLHLTQSRRTCRRKEEKAPSMQTHFIHLIWEDAMSPYTSECILQTFKTITIDTIE